MFPFELLSSEASAANLLEQVRWREGLCCPRCQSESVIKHGENAGHLVKIVFRLAETLFELDLVQNLRNLYPLGVPVRAVRRGGYVRIVNVLFGKISAHPRQPSERCYITRRRPIPG